MTDRTRQRLLRLSPQERRELLRRLGAGGAAPSAEPTEAAGHAAGPPATEAERTGRRRPATPAQVSQWYLWNLAPASDAYHVPHLFDLRGPLDEAALEEALRGVLARHEGLRVSFEQRAGRVWQRLGVVPTDVLRRGTADGRSAARRTLLAAACDPFDLRTGPLYRFALCRYGRDRNLLLLCFHHSVIDDHSATVLQRDLAARYAQAATGRPATLPASEPRPVDTPPTGGGARAAAGLRHWVETLRGGNPTIVPPDRVSTSATHPRSRVVVPLPTATVAAVRRLAASSGTTSYVGYLALSWLFLARLTGRRDITLGSPVSIRSGGRDRDAVGFFLNSLALRGAVRPEETPRDLVRRAHRVFTDAMAHREHPLDDVTRAVAGATGRPGRPLFRALLAYLRSDPDTERTALRLPGVTVSHEPVNCAHTAFDLGITVLDAGERITVLLDYAADLYDDASAWNWRTVWRMVAEAALRPDLPLAPLLREHHPPGRPGGAGDAFRPVPRRAGGGGAEEPAGPGTAVVAGDDAV
ncbi:condensation domain-containing protein, partial [Streptomyces triticirhizae]